MRDYLNYETLSACLDHLKEMICDSVYNEASPEIIITEIDVVEHGSER